MENITAEEILCKVKEMEIETFQIESEKKKGWKRNGKNIGDLWSNTQWPNLYVTGGPGIREEEKQLKQWCPNIVQIWWTLESWSKLSTLQAG